MTRQLALAASLALAACAADVAPEPDCATGGPVCPAGYQADCDGNTHGVYVTAERTCPNATMGPGVPLCPLASGGLTFGAPVCPMSAEPLCVRSLPEIGALACQDLGERCNRLGAGECFFERAEDGTLTGAVTEY